jgi:hypothetical protein
MACFIAITPIYSVAFGGKVRTGTTFADTSGNSHPGDIVWPQVTASPSPLALLPLDASAAALMPGSTIYVPPAPLPPSPWGVGLDAGD